MRDPSAAERLAATRDGITKLAVIGDVAGLRRASDQLPATIDAAYDRHRARALALALEGKADQAVAELNSGAADGLQDPSTVASDLAEVRLLAGDPRAAVAALTQDVTEPPRARRLALVGALTGAGAAAGAAASSAASRLRLQRPIDERLRVAAGAAALGSAVIALLLLPRTLDDENGGRAASGLQTPEKARPSVVRVPSPPVAGPTESAARRSERRAALTTDESAATDLPPGSAFGDLAPTSPPNGPSSEGPGSSPPPSTPPPAPPASPPPNPPSSAPTQPPAQPPAPAPAPPTQATRTQSSSSTPRPTAATTNNKPAQSQKKEKPVQSAKPQKKEKPAHPATSNAGGVSAEVPQGPPSNAAEQKGGPPGQEKKDEEKEKGPKK